MAIKKITFHLRGSQNDDEHLQLRDFIDHLNAIKTVLRDVEEYTAEGTNKVKYKVIDLKHNSPATVVLQAESIDATAAVVGSMFVDTLHKILQGQDPHLPSSLLNSFKELIPKKERVTEFLISTDDVKVAVTPEIRTHVDKMMGDDVVAIGSVAGKLELLNLHNTQVFRVYTVMGPKWIKCFFPKDLLPDVKLAIGKYINASGEIKYRGRDLEPYEVRIERIEALDFDETSPTLLDLKGLAPDATGKQSAEEFIRGVRDGNW
jgi:hypothetical protein